MSAGSGSAPPSRSSTSPGTAGPRTLGLTAVLGVLAGVVAKAADESGLTWAADLGSYPALWVLAVALVGRAAPTARAAAARAALFFAAMTLAYYAWAALVLGFGWNRLLPAWLVLSATAVAGVAAAVQVAARRSGLLPAAVSAAAAGIVLGGGALGGPPGHAVQAVADVAVVAVLLAVVPRDRRTRLTALLVVLPAAWVAARGLDLLRAVL